MRRTLEVVLRGCTVDVVSGVVWWRRSMSRHALQRQSLHLQRGGWDFVRPKGVQPERKRSCVAVKLHRNECLSTVHAPMRRGPGLRPSMQWVKRMQVFDFSMPRRAGLLVDLLGRKCLLRCNCALPIGGSLMQRALHRKPQDMSGNQRLR